MGDFLTCARRWTASRPQAIDGEDLYTKQELQRRSRKRGGRSAIAEQARQRELRTPRRQPLAALRLVEVVNRKVLAVRRTCERPVAQLSDGGHEPPLSEAIERLG